MCIPIPLQGVYLGGLASVQSECSEDGASNMSQYGYAFSYYGQAFINWWGDVKFIDPATNPGARDAIACQRAYRFWWFISA